MQKTAILVFGLDGATWKLLDPWIKKGKLPFLKKLIQKGVRGTLKSTLPPLTSTAWVSFQTGLSPLVHGVFGFQKTNGKLFSAKDIKQPTFWHLAGEKGKKSAIINMPLTYPPKPLNGCLITSFLTPPKSNFAYPIQLQEQLKKLNYQVDIMFEKLGFAPEKKLSSQQKKKLFKDLKSLINSRKRAGNLIINKENWDIFFILFKASDVAQHFFWKQKLTLEIYQEIDRAIRKLVENQRKKYPKTRTNILVISDHGFHPTAKNDICFYPLLRQLGLIPQLPWWWLKILRGIRKFTKSKLVEKLAYSQGIKAADWGLYWPNASQEKSKKLLQKLQGFKHQGKRVFSELILNQPGRENQPRILWLTNPLFAPNADPLAEKIFYRKKTYLKAHHHSDRNGIFAAAGPNIRKSKEKVSLEIIDLPINILRLLAISPLPQTDGKLLPQFFKFPKIAKRPQTEPKKTKTARPLNKKGEKLVIQRLKALGYVN
jgi:predicted AlkP superfamily phosphohydrolase/phosphomutase